VKRHLISAADLSRGDAVLILDTAEELASLADRPIKKLPTLRGRTVVNLFYEDSTRTRISFEAAAKRLSADVINFSAKGSSVAKGESLKDTALTLEAMGADAVVIRHGASGAAHRLAGWVRGSVLNAGDGTHEHPTQALLDLYTIHRQRPLNGLSVALIGELDKGRTARSLAYLLAKFERVKMFFVSPPETQMKPDILAYLEQHGVQYEQETNLDRVVGEVDVVYQTRIRPERLCDRASLKHYAIDSSVLRRMKSDAIILHPLPRTVELDKSVDDDPRALYFQQAKNGLYVRMALLTMLLERE